MAKRDEITKIYVELKSQEVIVVENTNTIKANKYDKLCYEINKDLIDNFLETINKKGERNYSSSIITNYLQLRLWKTLLKENHTPAQHKFINIVKDKVKKHNNDLSTLLDYIFEDIKNHCVKKHPPANIPLIERKKLERTLFIRDSNHSPKKKFPRTEIQKNNFKQE